MVTRPGQPRPSELSKDIAHAMNLFAHPMASWAAASAVGVGLATQAWGLWAGTMLGALENAGRLGDDALHAGEKNETVAAVKARAAAVNLMTEAQSLAREVAEERPAAAKTAAPTRRVRQIAPTAAAKEKPAAAAKAGRADDLKRIAGIGPKLEQVLNGLGISTFAEIARWDAAKVAWVEDQLGLAGRVERDGWVAEAKKLAQPRRK